MAIINAKITFFFGGRKWGWAEQWYWTGVDRVLQDVLQDARVLAGARRSFLGTLYSLEAYRVEEVDIGGNSFITGNSIISYNRLGAGPGDYGGVCQNPWQALLARFYADGDEYARNVLLRGIPDDKLCIGATYAVPYAFPLDLTNKLKNFFGLITNGTAAGTSLIGRVAMRAVSEPLGKDIHVKVIDVTVAGNGKFVITTNDPIQVRGAGGVLRDALVGDTIHVHGPRASWARGLSADHKVITATAAAPWIYGLSGKQVRTCAVEYNMNAIAWGVNRILVTFTPADPATGIVNPELSRPVNKKTGKPFFGTRGRRPSRA